MPVKNWLPRKKYLEELPKVIVAVGVLVRDSDDRILIVKQSYCQDGWSLPGGTVNGK
jgi:ADP-ribose pyrophosphatase YjhB (NUDIX family)